MKMFATVILLFAVIPAFAAMQQVKLSVPDMNCAACPITIKKVISKVNGVSQIEVSTKIRQAVVTYDDAKTNVRAITEAMANVGFPATVMVPAQ